MDERSAHWAVPRCVGVGDVSHLYEAGLPVQPRGIVGNVD
jgi:probable phosphoglycerate mutase